jgi:hypothetical protein
MPIWFLSIPFLSFWRRFLKAAISITPFIGFLFTNALLFVGLCLFPSLFHILLPYRVNSPEEAVPTALSSIWNGPSSGMKKTGFQIPSEAKAISYGVPLDLGV